MNLYVVLIMTRQSGAVQSYEMNLNIYGQNCSLKSFSQIKVFSLVMNEWNAWKFSGELTRVSLTKIVSFLLFSRLVCSGS